MSVAVKRLVTMLLAWVLCANAAGAGALGAFATSCCGDSEPAVATSAHACAESTDAATHACEAAVHPDERSPSACGEQCAHCGLYQASTPAAIVTSPASAFGVRAPFERPSLAAEAVPAARPERLERPPRSS